MRLLRLGEPGAEAPAVLDRDGRLLDLSAVVSDVDGRLLGGGLDRVSDAVASGSLPLVADTRARVGPPVTGIGKIVCVGLNYADHAAETGAAAADRADRCSSRPRTRSSARTTTCSSPGRTETDWEVELAVVHRRDGPLSRLTGRGRRPRRRRLRDPQRRLRARVPARSRRPVGQGQELRDLQPARSLAGHRGRGARPAGARPAAVGSTGSRARTASTPDMIFGVHHLVWYISQFMVLRPGDVINTGTPAGVALGRPDLPYLTAGDVLRAGDRRARPAAPAAGMAA